MITINDVITLDFETYFDHEYTLNRKLTTEEYIRDPRFEVHGCGIRWGDGSASWYSQNDFVQAIHARCDLTKTVILAHHAHFDGLILAHHYGLSPGLWIDTLPMARLLLGNHVRIGLDRLATYFGLPNKTMPYDEMRGKRWAHMSADLRRRIADGCLHDCHLSAAIFMILAREFPPSEYGVVDATIRMFTEPCVIGDTELFKQVVDDEIAETDKLLAALGVTGEQLRSAETFAGLLEQVGVEP